nr:unnamed protein product [Callosobruchus analis]
MSPTVHKVLIHGSAIVEKALLSIGQLSEEAQEANNKMFKKYREGFSRRFSREQTNADISNRLLISSDPVISSMRQPEVRRRTLDKDVMHLLRSPSEFIKSETSEKHESNSHKRSPASCIRLRGIGVENGTKRIPGLGVPSKAEGCRCEVPAVVALTGEPTKCDEVAGAKVEKGVAVGIGLLGEDAVTVCGLAGVTIILGGVTFDVKAADDFAAKPLTLMEPS